MDGRALMRRLALLSASFAIVVTLAAAPAGAQEIIVTGAGAGAYPVGVTYLGVPLRGIELGMGLGVAGNSGLGQFKATLTSLAEGQDILVEGLVNASVPSAPNTAVFSGTCTVDPGNGTLPLAGVPFAAMVAANADGTGTVTLNLGGTNLPAAAIHQGFVTIQ
jgi:hypothetical protein